MQSKVSIKPHLKSYNLKAVLENSIDNILSDTTSR